MKLNSPIPPKKARIEIIPLIDIMFFLLACFMLVSLSMTQMRGMKVALPSAVTATPENKSDFHAITIDAIGNLYLEKKQLAMDALIEAVKDTLARIPRRGSIFVRTKMRPMVKSFACWTESSRPAFKRWPSRSRRRAFHLPAAAAAAPVETPLPVAPAAEPSTQPATPEP
jgi:biopolymer transport protein ExbD